MSDKKLNLYSRSSTLFVMLFLAVGVIVASYFYFYGDKNKDDAMLFDIDDQETSETNFNILEPELSPISDRSLKHFTAANLYELNSIDRSKFREDYVREYYPPFIIIGTIIINEYDFGLCGRRIYSIGCGRKVEGLSLSYIAFSGVTLQDTANLTSGENIRLKCHKIDVKDNGNISVDYCDLIDIVEDDFSENEQILFYEDYNIDQSREYLDNNNCQVVSDKGGKNKWSNDICNQSQYGKGYIDGYNKIEI